MSIIQARGIGGFQLRRLDCVEVVGASGDVGDVADPHDIGHWFAGLRLGARTDGFQGSLTIN